MGNAIKFRHTSAPRHPSETARIKIVKGSDYGTIFILTGARATIGRGDENDIVLSDLKASRLHAELIFNQNNWKIKDLGSANGILWNDQVKSVSDLKPHDTVSIGETVFEFFTPDVHMSVLEAPAREISNIINEQSNLSLRKAEIRALAGVKNTEDKKRGKNLEKTDLFSKKSGLIGLVVIIIFLVLFLNPQPEQKNLVLKNKTDEIRDLASYLPESIPTAQDKTAEMYYRSGFREYREGNYLRAKTQFETVLQILPGHRLAGIYLEKCESSIKEEVRTHLERGKKSFDSGKLKKAKGHYEAVLRLLFRDQTSKEYFEAKEQLEKLVIHE